MPAILDNMVLSKEGNSALTEAFSNAQPGDKLPMKIEVNGQSIAFELEVVESLADRISFNVCDKDDDDDDGDEPSSTPSDSAIGASVMGVMSKSAKK